MIRRMTFKKAAAVIAMIAMMSSGTAPVFAATPQLPTEDRAPRPTWFVQLIDAKGQVVSIEQPTSQVASEPLPMLPMDMGQLRERLVRQRNGPTKSAAIASRLLRLLDIAEAKTASERHEKIRNLPVTIKSSAATDGRDGLVYNYIVDGKTRLRRFIPSEPRTTESSERETGGPFVMEDCYDGPEPCATEQEMEDFDILNADVASELDSSSSQLAAESAEFANYCASFPGDEVCQGLEPLPSGPSACDPMVDGPCWQYALGSAGWVGVGIVNLGLRVASRAAAAAAGTTLAAASVYASTAALIGSAFMAGWYLGTFIDCKWLRRY